MNIPKSENILAKFSDRSEQPKEFYTCRNLENTYKNHLGWRKKSNGNHQRPKNELVYYMLKPMYYWKSTKENLHTLRSVEKISQWKVSYIFQFKKLYKGKQNKHIEQRS